AVRECPWSKVNNMSNLDLYTMAFRELKSQFKAEELDEVMNVMIEKEIRLRVAIENFDDGTIPAKDLDTDEVNDPMAVDQGII
ncbi:7771_t:CDS:2, partial [Acaulospora morrowiae]